MTKSLEQQAEIMLNRLSVIRSHLDNGVPAGECRNALLQVRDEIEALLISAQTREKTGEKDSKRQNAQRADGKSQTRSEGKGGKKYLVVTELPQLKNEWRTSRSTCANRSIPSRDRACKRTGKEFV